MATKKTTSSKGENFHVIRNSKTGAKKSCSAKDYLSFQENSPEAGDWEIESSHETAEQASEALTA